MQKRITNLYEQTKYHSFLVICTKEKQIAEKWKYYILSIGGQLSMNTQQSKNNQNQYQYFCSVDTIACEIGQRFTKKYILTVSDWLKNILQPTQTQLLNKIGMLKFDTLQISKKVTFFQYINQQNINYQTPQHITPQTHKKSIFQNISSYILPNLSQKFIELKPKYLHVNDCIIFQIQQQSSLYLHIDSKQKVKYVQSENTQDIITNNLYKKLINNIYFKYISKQCIQKNQHQNHHNFFRFSSEYALLSDKHFLNCLTRGRKNIGYYQRIGESYRFQIEEEIYRRLKSLNFQAKL